MTRRRLSAKRVREIAAGYSATHDVETVPLAEELLEARAELHLLRPVVEQMKQEVIEASEIAFDCARICTEQHGIMPANGADDAVQALSNQLTDTKDTLKSAQIEAAKWFAESKRAYAERDRLRTQLVAWALAASQLMNDEVTP